MPETIKEPKYNKVEQEYKDFLMKRLRSAKNQKDASYAELNDKSPVQWYEDNAKAANAYNPPKVNKGDTRIVSGTTHEKEISLVSALLNFNLEANINAFDKNDLIINEVGETMEELVKKSREIEEFDKRKPLVYKELLDQGTTYAEERWVEEQIVKKELTKEFDGTKLNETKWAERIVDLQGKCKAVLMSTMKVYLGNMKAFDIDDQPDLFTLEVIDRAKAKSLYGDWERWDNVPIQISSEIEDPTTIYNDWTIQALENDMVAVVKYQNKWTNDYMIMLNDVMMLPVIEVKGKPSSFPLTAISPSGKYSLAKGDIEPISNDFSLSTSSPAKTEVDQGVIDETLKLMVLAQQKSFKPPMANMTGRVLSKDIFLPGNITNDIDPTKLAEIGENKGVTNAQLATYEAFKRLVDEKTVSAAFTGAETKGQRTLGEVMELKRQQMMKLGLIMWGVVQFEIQMTWLRIYNILANWTKPIDKRIDGNREEIFRTITVNTTLENGEKGVKIFEFNKDLANGLDGEKIRDIEDNISEQTGKKTRLFFLDPVKLQNIAANWYITITPTEKETSELDRVLITQDISDAIALFGPESINQEYAKIRWAKARKEDPNQFFSQQQQGQPAGGAMGGQPPAVGGEVGGQIGQAVTKPNLTNLTNLTK